MIHKRAKKAISPVIATVILVSIVVVIGIIILIWALSFNKEQITKTVEGSTVPIEQYCDRVDLSASYDGYNIEVNNEGSVALSSIQVVFEDSGDKTPVSCTGASLATAASKTISLSDSCESGAGTPVAVIPVLTGEDKDGVPKDYVCENQEFPL